MNDQVVHHKLIFNRLELHPIIISGWPCMESYYNLPSEVVQTDGYYGNNNYGMLSFKEVHISAKIRVLCNCIETMDMKIFCCVVTTGRLNSCHCHPRHTKLGYGWDEVCKFNNFKSGNRIRFRFDVTSLNKTCYVYLFL
ncbi:unnamed protein product [Vicia faba]|uniref:TF-B3 domain-containing protein n=1 Tax=Vicia faba TaxID=3906 RepID=A0AAV0ZKC2_VICFA|nr:unnamed protein product [Vicia faba]